MSSGASERLETGDADPVERSRSDEGQFDLAGLDVGDRARLEFGFAVSPAGGELDPQAAAGSRGDVVGPCLHLRRQNVRVVRHGHHDRVDVGGAACAVAVDAAARDGEGGHTGEAAGEPRHLEHHLEHLL